MAFSEGLKTISGEAAADLSAKQYRFVKMDTAGQYNVAGDGGEIDGISQNDPDAQGKALTVGTDGISKLEAGGTVAIGDYISSDSVGRGVVAASADFIGGQAKTAATVGAYFACEIRKDFGRL